VLRGNQTSDRIVLAFVLALTIGLAFSTVAFVSAESLTWTNVSSPDAGLLDSVYCLTASDCWAVGWFNPAEIHWDGSSWSLAFTNPGPGRLNSVHCSAANDCWAVGWLGTTIHWDGSTWSDFASVTTDTLDSVFCATHTDCWAVGQSSILHWDGSSWLDFTNPTGNALNSVACLATNDCWAAASGPILHWDGSTWSAVASGITDYLGFLYCVSSTGCWGLGGLGIIHWDGSSWSVVTNPAPPGLYSVYCVNVADCWGVSVHEGIFYWDGSSWSAVAGPPLSDPYFLYLESVFCATATDCWSVGGWDRGLSGTGPSVTLHALIPTTTSVQCTPPSVSINAPATCTVIVSGVSPTGTVSFTSTSMYGSFPSGPTCSLTSGSCHVTYTDAHVGSPVITATYSGDALNPGSSGSTTLTVTLRSTITSVNCIPNPVAVNAPALCTATVDDNDAGVRVAPTGTVTFSIDVGAGTFTNPGTFCILSGSGTTATCHVTYTPSLGSIDGGKHQLVATYSGDAGHSSSFNTASLAIRLRSTSTSEMCSPSQIYLTGQVTCTVTVTDTDVGTLATPSGTVTFTNSGSGAFIPSAMCSLVSGSCSVTYMPSTSGVQQISSTYLGDLDHSSSSSTAELTATDFSLGSIASMTIGVGGTGSTSATVSSINGFDSPVTLSTPPSVGISVLFTPNPVALSGSAEASSTLSVSLQPSVTPGSRTFTVSGTYMTLTRSTSLTVNIVATSSSISNLIDQLLASGCIDNAGVANSLKAKLSSAQSYIDSGDSVTATNILSALLNELEAQDGDHLAASCTIGGGMNFDTSTVLATDTQSLIDSLTVNGVANPITGSVVSSSGSGVAGVTLTIFDSGGHAVATATSDITGFYFFASTSSLVPGSTYTVRVTGFPTGFTTSNPPSQSFTWAGTAISLDIFVLS
jgi:hypothetical protein